MNERFAKGEGAAGYGGSGVKICREGGGGVCEGGRVGACEVQVGCLVLLRVFSILCWNFLRYVCSE